MSATRSPRSARLATDVVVLRDGEVVAADRPRQFFAPRPAARGRNGEGGAVLDMRVSGHDQVFGIRRQAAAAGEIVAEDGGDAGHDDPGEAVPAT